MSTQTIFGVEDLFSEEILIQGTYREVRTWYIAHGHEYDPRSHLLAIGVCGDIADIWYMPLTLLRHQDPETVWRDAWTALVYRVIRAMERETPDLWDESPPVPASTLATTLDRDPDTRFHGRLYLDAAITDAMRDRT